MAASIFAVIMSLFAILLFTFFAILLAPGLINLVADSIVETRLAVEKLKEVLKYKSDGK